MKRLDIVQPIEGRSALRSGSGEYAVAVVVSMDPFVLTSVDTSMTWTHQKPEDFELYSIWYDLLSDDEDEVNETLAPVKQAILTGKFDRYLNGS